MPMATRQQSRWDKTLFGTPPPTISSGASMPLRTESSVDSNSRDRPGRPPSRSGQSGLLTGRMGSSLRSSLAKASAADNPGDPYRPGHAPALSGASPGSALGSALDHLV